MYLVILAWTIIAIMLDLHKLKGKSFSNSGQDYIPNETRLIPFSKYFCQSLKLVTNYTGNSEYNASLHIIENYPFLFDHSILYIESTEHLTKNKLYYFHFGSLVNIEACNQESLISNYCSMNISKIFSDGSTSYVDGFTIISCEEGVSTHTFSFDDEGYYFFNVSHFDFCDMYVRMSLNATSYSLYSNTSISSCFVSTSKYNSSCSVNVPFSKTTYALLTIEPNSSAVNSKYDDIPLETICEPRVWVYLVAFILLISLAICLFSFCLL